MVERLPWEKSNRAGRENCQSIVHEHRSEGLILHHPSETRLETLTRGMNLKNLSLLYYSSFGGDLRSLVYVS